MPARKPAHLKLVLGTSRLDREPRKRVAPRAGKARPPTWLDPLAKASFRGLATEVEALGMPSRSFVHLLTIGAVDHATVKRCEQSIADHGAFYDTTTTTGAPKILPRPEVSARNAALKRLRSTLSDLGLTPVAIGRVDRAALPDSPKAADPLAKYRRPAGATRG